MEYHDEGVFLGGARDDFIPIASPTEEVLYGSRKHIYARSEKGKHEFDDLSPVARRVDLRYLTPSPALLGGIVSF
jgi:hypothetical protein